MGYQKGKGKGWRTKYIAVLVGGARFLRFQTAMLQDAREMKECCRHNTNANKYIKHKKGSYRIQKRIAKFNPKTWTNFNKDSEIGKNIVTNFFRQLENPGHKKKTQNKPAQLNTLQNMEVDKARIAAKSL